MFFFPINKESPLHTQKVTYYVNPGGKQRFEGQAVADFAIIYHGKKYFFNKGDLSTLSTKIDNYCKQNPSSSQFDLASSTLQDQEAIIKTLKLLAGFKNVEFTSEQILEVFPLILELGIENLLLC